MSKRLFKSEHEARFWFTTDQDTAEKLYDLMLDALEKFAHDPSGVLSLAGKDLTKGGSGAGAALQGASAPDQVAPTNGTPE